MVMLETSVVNGKTTYEAPNVDQKLFAGIGVFHECSAKLNQDQL